MTPSLRVLSVASEMFPLVKTGGLADVVGALPAALAKEGVEVRTLLPGYPAVMEGLVARTMVRQLPDWFGGEARLLSGTAAGRDLFVLEAPHLYQRGGLPYTGPDGADWPDNAERFGALARAGAWLAQGLAGFVPDVVHAHDWQAGLLPAYLPAYLPGGKRPGTVFTVHNLAFQGWFPATKLSALGLPPESFTVEGVEYNGGIGMLKAGLRLSDRITTVSPTYAAEIQTPAGGMGLDGLLRARSASLSGILNGLDDAVWDPAHDAHIENRFAPGNLRRRSRNKAVLQARMGLQLDNSALLCGVVSRLTDQKGMDLLLQALPSLLAGGAQLVVLGTGEPLLASGFAAVAQAHPGRVSVFLGFDEGLAHVVQAGIDALFVPSRFEPCGLTQLAALRYGAIPVVSRVGGLSDTVVDANEAALASGVATGIQFWPVDQSGLEGAIRRLLTLWADPKLWARLQRNAMAAEVGWTGPARAYAALYRGLRA